MTPSATCYTINEPMVIADVIDGEAIVIHLDTGTYYSMEGVGASLWASLTGGVPLETAAAALAGVAGAPADADAQARAFADRLLAEGLLRPADAASSADAAPDAIVPAGWVAPVLHAFSDMQSMLLLDPIHKVNEAGWPYTAPQE